METEKVDEKRAHIHVYLARDLTVSRQNLDKDEIIEVVQYPIEDTLKMISAGQIADGLTILALQSAWLYLQHPDEVSGVRPDAR
jgi:hypothetical protein